MLLCFKINIIFFLILFMYTVLVFLGFFVSCMEFDKAEQVSGVKILICN